MLNNSEILDIIFKTYNVSSMIKKLIKNSTLDFSYKDLEQQIYIVLFLMDNEKLNKLFDNGTDLKKWISRIILNKRNEPTKGNYRNDWQKSRFIEHQPILDIQEDKLNHNFMLDFLEDELNKYDWNKDMTKEEIVMAGNYEILKFYMNSGYSMSKISKQFGVSSTKINQMIISAKNNIKISYDTNFDIWFDNINGEFMGTTTE